MNKQEVFDKVVAHARKQGKKSVADVAKDEPPACRYQTREGLKCFVGALIPGHLYTPFMEDTNVHMIAELYPSVMDVFDDSVDTGFLWKIQKIHDHTPVDKWEESFKEFAKAEKLVYA